MYKLKPITDRVVKNAREIPRDAAGNLHVPLQADHGVLYAESRYDGYFEARQEL